LQWQAWIETRVSWELLRGIRFGSNWKQCGAGKSRHLTSAFLWLIWDSRLAILPKARRTNMPWRSHCSWEIIELIPTTTCSCHFFLFVFIFSVLVAWRMSQPGR
jgi:hypothetical protein